MPVLEKIELPLPIMEEIVARVEPRTAEALSSFLADAALTYLRLVDLVREGGELLMRDPAGKIHSAVLPFQKQPQTTPDLKNR